MYIMLKDSFIKPTSPALVSDQSVFQFHAPWRRDNLCFWLLRVSSLNYTVKTPAELPEICNRVEVYAYASLWGSYASLELWLCVYMPLLILADRVRTSHSFVFLFLDLFSSIMNRDDV